LEVVSPPPPPPRSVAPDKVLSALKVRVVLERESSCVASEDVTGLMRAIRKDAVAEAPLVMQAWSVNRETSRMGGWHHQARTEDGFTSFAVITAPGENPNYTIAKAADGVTDVFVLVTPDMRQTMNVLGKIRYTGDWKTGIST